MIVVPAIEVFDFKKIISNKLKKIINADVSVNCKSFRKSGIDVSSVYAVSAFYMIDQSHYGIRIFVSWFDEL